MKITKDTIATLTAPNFLLEDTIDEIQQFLLKIVGDGSIQEVVEETEQDLQAPTQDYINPDKRATRPFNRYDQTQRWINTYKDVVYSLLRLGYSASEVSTMLKMKSSQSLRYLFEYDDEFTQTCKSIINEAKNKQVDGRSQSVTIPNYNNSHGRHQKTVEWIVQNQDTIYRLLEAGWPMSRVCRSLHKHHDAIHNLMKIDDDFTRRCKLAIEMAKR